ncbi:hypothetical protein CPC16_011482 [Podila verticillata]|nr:hypothetical protein CPC16_011482 [Podila verticillata]
MPTSDNWMQFVARADEVYVEQAVEEKRQRLAAADQFYTGTHDLLPPVPLSNVASSSSSDLFVGEIEDIAFGFSETLSKFVVHKSRVSHVGGPWPFFRIDRIWNLPCLRYFNCRSYQRPISCSPDIFSGYPFLERVETFDNMREYDPLAIEYGQPAALHRLRGLNFQGHSALQFHPGTLHTTGNLESLQLGMCPFNDDVNHFIPEAGYTMSPHSYVPVIASTTTLQRPIWTWDWFLPRVISIELSATFAYTFQFKMLLGCPNIAMISLTISSNIPAHQRQLTTFNFEVPVTETEGIEQLEQDAPISPRQMTLPTLKSVLLIGNWEFSDEWIQILLHQVGF